MDIYHGPVCASHHNCRALTPGQRQLTDDMIRSIAERGGVIGAAFDSWMLDPGWQRDRKACEQESGATLQTVVDHIDHVAQLTGTSRHCGIGTDLDGGFGTEQAPRDLNTIADLQGLVPLLGAKGFDADDIEGILSRNWLRLLGEHWRDSL
jgi:membrane dipeptidase